LEATNLNYWKTGKFCVKYDEKTAFENQTTAAATNCKTGWVKCNTCQCVQCKKPTDCTAQSAFDTNCPITAFEISEETPAKDYTFTLPLVKDPSNIVTSYDNKIFVAGRAH
jgi:hypothetical protein